MAGNVSTVDGMGFEEVNQSSFTEMISGNNLYGNNLWVSDMAELNIVSGVTFSGGQAIFEDMVVRDDLACNVLSEDNDKRVYSTSYQNGSDVYGMRVRAGSVLIGDDSSGLILFTDNWAGATPGLADSYFITLTPRNWTLPIANTTGSITGFSISGTRRASGCWAYGPSGTVADWIAVGI